MAIDRDDQYRLITVARLRAAGGREEPARDAANEVSREAGEA